MISDQTWMICVIPVMWLQGTRGNDSKDNLNTTVFQSVGQSIHFFLLRITLLYLPQKGSESGPRCGSVPFTQELVTYYPAPHATQNKLPAPHKPCKTQ
jgi:hypothetical protein